MNTELKESKRAEYDEKGRKIIGFNSEGEQLVEDKKGVRTRFMPHGVGRMEPMTLTSTLNGVRLSPLQREDTFKTVEELDQEKNVRKKLNELVNPPENDTKLPAEETQANATIKPLNLLIFDNFYKANPEKVLGMPYKASGRTGEVTKYRGTIDDLDKIKLADDFLPGDKSNDPLLSVVADHTFDTIKDKEVITNIKKAVASGEKELGKKLVKKLNKVSEFEEPITYELNPFDKVFRENNPDISEDELKAFIWYKFQIGQPLNGAWKDLTFDGKVFSPHKVSTEEIRKWVENLILCYYKSQLIPAYLYFAENIWERKSTLEDEKSDIVHLYGKEVYQKQSEKLNKIFEKVYKKRLILDDEDEEKRLVILPTSEFAKTFTINTLSDKEPFKIKPFGTKKNKGEPDFLKDPLVDKKKLFDQLSLTNAFLYYLVKNRSSISYKKGSNYQEIITVYINGRPKPLDLSQSVWKAIKARSKSDADRLFAEFLATQLRDQDRIAIETQWNTAFNGYQKIDYNKVPIGFTTALTYRNDPVEIRAEKREGVAFIFSEGSGCIAYDVGFGKTWTAIFTIAQFLDAGYCKRPFIVVPNQTYKQWLFEIKGLLPHIPINDLYNLSQDYVDEITGANGQIQKVPSGSITMLTYEGLERIGFNQYTENSMLSELYDILSQGDSDDSKQTEKQREVFYGRLQTLLGKGLKGTLINIEDLGLDFFCADEAHAMKKVFTKVRGSQKAGEAAKRGRVQYDIQSGEPSSIGLKGFMIAQYILRNNLERNVMLLTATPFTNSPLEIFSSLSLIAYKKLKETQINNLVNFFDNYINTSTELVINNKLRPERKQVVLGFNNLPALQTLIFRFINFKNADTKDIRGNTVKIVRPDKYILPIKSKLVDGQVIPLPPNEQVSTNLSFTPHQAEIMSKIRLYVEAKISYTTLCSLTAAGNYELTTEELDEEEITDDTEGTEVDEDELSDNEKAGVRALRGVNLARNLALSPFLYKCNGLGLKPDYKEYIETSPKLLYTIKCVQSVKKWHEDRNEPVSGQIIYMDRGTDYFDLIKEYLVKEVGFQPHEVGIIRSKMKGGKAAKDAIKNQFLGMEYDEKTRTFKDIPHEDRIKVLIGSSTIREGMNLQRYTTNLYQLFLEWNPTDEQQLAGRLWRQGNEYGSVRITYPLTENSMDIFMFQKNEEKTSRINQIWNVDGETSVLKLEEFDPAELKYQLISDPYVISELEVKEENDKIDEKISGIESIIRRAEHLEKAKKYVESNQKQLRSEVGKFHDILPDQIISNPRLVSLLQEVIKTQKDGDGNPVENPSQNVKKTWGKKPSTYNYVKPYWLDEIANSIKTLQREEKDFLAPRNLKINSLGGYILSLQEEVKKLKENKKQNESSEAIQQRVEEILEEREDNNFESKTIEERVEEFESLNYLLADKRIKEIPKLKEVSFDAAGCPPMDASGTRRIDEEAIRMLEVCIANLPETKALHTLSPDTYTEDREILHTEIIQEVIKDKVCVEKVEPIAVLTGGLPGSGKSTFLKKYSKWLTGNEVFKIDADDIRSRLPEYKGWNASATHLETKDIINKLLDIIGTPCLFDLIYDGTMNTARNYIPLINKINELGYKTFIIYMQVPYEVSVKRVLERYQRSGRYVPLRVIQDTFNKGLEAFNEIKKLVNGYVLVDGMTYEIIEKGGEEIPKDRGYQIQKFDQTVITEESEKPDQENNDEEEKEIALQARLRKLKLAQASANARKRKVRTIKLKLKFQQAA